MLNGQSLCNEPIHAQALLKCMNEMALAQDATDRGGLCWNPKPTGSHRDGCLHRDPKPPCAQHGDLAAPSREEVPMNRGNPTRPAETWKPWRDGAGGIAVPTAAQAHHGVADIQRSTSQPASPHNQNWGLSLWRDHPAVRACCQRRKWSRGVTNDITRSATLKGLMNLIEIVLEAMRLLAEAWIAIMAADVINGDRDR